MSVDIFGALCFYICCREMENDEELRIVPAAVYKKSVKRDKLYLKL